MLNLKSAVCLKGHRLTSNLKLEDAIPQKFCSECGEKIIDKCPECNTPLKSYSSNSLDFIVEKDFGESVIKEHGLGPVGKRCHECGKPYPWN